MSYTKEDYAMFDRIINKTLINIYTKAKETNKIYFSEVASDSPADWCILKIAQIAQQFWGFNIYTNINPITNWKLSKKLGIHPRLKTWFKEPDNVVKIFDLQSFVVESENQLIDIYTNIYNEYYKERTKNGN